MNSMKNMIIVPWFSRNEWLEVYEKVFSCDYQDIKYAIDLMNVWSVRVTKLPMGVEATLVLLRAKCSLHEISKNNTTNAESNSTYTIKNKLLCLAVGLFVSTVVKSVENKYFEKKSQHQLAKMIDLPLYLVNLRNDIFHNNKLDSMCNTIERAFEDCIQWVKINYWNVEHLNMQKQIDSHQVKLDVQDKKTEDVLDNLSKKCLHAVPVLLSKNVNEGTSEVENILKGTLKKQVSTVEIYALCSTLAKSLFLPVVRKIEKNAADCKSIKQSFIDILDKLSFLLKMVEKQNETTTFLCVMVQYIHNSEFISLLVGRMNEDNLDIRKFVKSLLCEENLELSKFAVSLMEKNSNIFSEEQIEQVMLLIKIMDGNVNDEIIQDEDTSDMECQLYNVEKLEDSINEGDAVLPLGIISEDQNHPDFYKELILNI